MAKNKKNFELLTVKDLCALLQVDATTIYRMQSDATFPKPVKIGGSVRWIADEIHKWVLTKRQGESQTVNAKELQG